MKRPEEPGWIRSRKSILPTLHEFCKPVLATGSACLVAASPGLGTTEEWTTMPTAHPRPWHRGSLFGEGPRVPMDRERRAVWKARIEIHRRARRITDGESYIGLALLKRLGQDGRCDPSHQTLAEDSGESVSTVQRALKAFLACGMVSWVRRLVRDGWRACQTSNAYLLTVGKVPEIPGKPCDGQTGRETRRDRYSSVQQAAPEVSPAAQHKARAALARIAAQREAVLQARLLNKG
jgi:hypothetical protein